MPSERVNEAPFHEDIWGLYVLIDALLTLELDEVMLKFTPHPLYPRRNRASDTYWIGSSVHYRTSLYGVEKKCLESTGDRNMIHRSLSP
jgi:hypothetical protein